MNGYSFIFSEKKYHRPCRHLVFWLLWALYFSLSFFHYQQAGVEKVEFEAWSFPFFIKAILVLLIHVSACYFFIEYLMPKYLFPSRYAFLAICILILSVLILIISYFVHSTVFPLIDAIFHHQPALISQNIWWTSISSGLLSAPKVICAATAVKLLKRWWFKQKEKEELEKEKLIADLQLLKAQMHPDFLFSSLNNITCLTQQKNIGKASKSLLMLADILSYMLYDSDNAFVPLGKEIKTIKDYLALEKTKLGEQLEIDVAIRGEIDSTKIVPLLLFPFIENSFAFFGNTQLERAWINLELQIENMQLTMRLIHGKTMELETGPSLEKALKRLEFFYAGNYELKTTVEPEIMMTHLRVSLHENGQQSQPNRYTKKESLYAAS